MNPVPTHELPESASHSLPNEPPEVAMQHPKGLYVLSVAEACERFAFYLLLTLFALFLNERHGFSMGRSALWFGNFTAAVYFTPFLGGYLAAQVLRPLSAVRLGALLLGLGYLTLAGAGANLMLASLALLALGNGLFKPNISALVASLYAPNDARREGGFRVFYCFVQIGGLFGPFVGDWVRVRYGWTAAFLLAAVAMLASLLILWTGQRQLLEEEGQPRLEEAPRTNGHWLALFVLCVAVVPYWMAYFQMGSTLAFFARDNVARTVGSFLIPPGWFAGSNSFFVLVLTPAIARLCVELRLSVAGQIIAGIFLTAGAFLFLAAVSRSGAPVHWVLLFHFYLVISVGELLLSPVGLSAVARLAPSKWVGLCLGFWFLAVAGGNLLAGQLGAVWGVVAPSTLWALNGVVLVVVGFALWLGLGWLRELLQGDEG